MWVSHNYRQRSNIFNAHALAMSMTTQFTLKLIDGRIFFQTNQLCLVYHWILVKPQFFFVFFFCTVASILSVLWTFFSFFFFLSLVFTSFHCQLLSFLSATTSIFFDSFHFSFYFFFPFQVEQFETIVHEFILWIMYNYYSLSTASNQQ